MYHGVSGSFLRSGPVLCSRVTAWCRSLSAPRLCPPASAILMPVWDRGHLVHLPGASTGGTDCDLQL